MQLKNFNDLFKNKYFIIPNYQRGFAWEKSQITDFIKDIKILQDSLKSNPENKHYTGLITLKQIEKYNNEESLFEVIDGQQRLTTTIILINKILEKIPTLKQKYYNYFIYNQETYHYRLSYHTDTPSHDYFKQQILKQDKELQTAEKSFYTHNLKKADELFHQELHNLNDDEVMDLFNTLINSFVVNEYIIDDKLNIHQTFETMNNRGKHLSTLELLKNRFLCLSPQLDLNEKELKSFEKKINDSYNTIYHYLGKPINPLNDDYFLNIHFLSYPKFTYNRAESKIFSDYLLKDKFSITSKNLSKDEITDYLADLSSSSKSFYIIHHPAEYYKTSMQERELVLYLEKLNYFGFTTFKPLLMNAITLYNEEIIKLTDCINFLKTLEKFMFITFSLSGYTANYKNKIFYNLAKDIKKNHNITLITEKINNILLRDPDIFINSTNFNFKNFKKYNKIKDSNFYNWKYVKYTLYEYELNLHENPNNALDKKDASNMINDLKLWVSNPKDQKEHIAPQQPEEYWKKQFEGEDYNKSINLIGNLLLLRQDKNIELSNRPFPSKKEHCYKRDSLSSIEVEQKENWNLETIIERGEKIFSFINKKYELKLTNEEISNLAKGNF